MRHEIEELRERLLIDEGGADSAPDQCSWSGPAEDDVWLALDRSGNGAIDDGTELFGDHTHQPISEVPNGFAALAEYDALQKGGDGDGWITARDAVYSNLRVWRDQDHNGISSADELVPLADVGVWALGLRYQNSRITDENGNWLRFRARVLASQRATVGRWAYDVYLVVAPE